jgi:hypothetical protein
MVSQRFPIGRFICALMSMALAASVGTSLSSIQAENTIKHSSEREVLYMPNGQALSVVSIGYRNSLAHLLWFTTVDYFGRHYASDKNYQWLGHMCDLVTTLSPRLPHVYQFCSNMLSWEANTPQRSIPILAKAMQNLPNDWRFPYLRGVTHMFFLKDTESASKDFLLAARLPGAHAIVKRLAAKTLASLETPETAVEFLDEMIRQEQDPNARRALEHRRMDLVLQRGDRATH